MLKPNKKMLKINKFKQEQIKHKINKKILKLNSKKILL